MRKCMGCIISILLLISMLCSLILTGCVNTLPESSQPQLQASVPTADSSEPAELPTDPNSTIVTDTTHPHQTELIEPPSLELGYYTAEHYLYYPELFVPVWADQWQPPAQMLDFEEKYASFLDPDGRLMSVAHRADNNVYYPENSIEAILSAIMMGVDVVEVDICKTKDNVLVLMHDETLTRTTNVKELRAQGVEGLPQSNYVRDWTLDQLRQLRLKKGSKTITNYIIPTLEECIMICKDRCFVTMDKAGRFSYDYQVYPMIRKYEAYREVLIPYTYYNDYGSKTIKVLMDRIQADSGYKGAYMAWCSVHADTMNNVISDLAEHGICLGLRCGEWNIADADLFRSFAGKARIYVETLVRANDKVEVWAQIDDTGVNLVMTDIRAFELCQFIAQRYFSE